MSDDYMDALFENEAPLKRVTDIKHVYNDVETKITITQLKVMKQKILKG